MNRKLSYANVARILVDLESGVTPSELARQYGVAFSCITYWRRYVGLNEHWIAYVNKLEAHANYGAKRSAVLARQVDAGAQVIMRLEADARRRSKIVPLLRTTFRLGRKDANTILGLSVAVGCKSRARACDDEIVSLIQDYMADNPGHSFARMFHTILRDKSFKRRDAVAAYVAARDRQASTAKTIGLPARTIKPMCVQGRLNQVWSMDFLVDVLPSGRRFWVLCVVDDFNREAVLIRAVYRHTAAAVVQALNGLSATGRLPQTIRSDNGAEFKSRLYEHWVAKHHVAPKYTRPGKPNDNAYVERFNRILRDEVLSRYCFKSLLDVQRTIDDWRVRYNFARPHQALDGFSPLQFAYVVDREREAPSNRGIH